jgi:hypothetical protein
MIGLLTNGRRKPIVTDGLEGESVEAMEERGPDTEEGQENRIDDPGDLFYLCGKAEDALVGWKRSQHGRI